MQTEFYENGNLFSIKRCMIEKVRQPTYDRQIADGWNNTWQITIYIAIKNGAVYHP